MPLSKVFTLALVLGTLTHSVFAAPDYTLSCELEYRANGLVHTHERKGTCSEGNHCFAFNTENIPLITKLMLVHTYYDTENGVGAIELEGDGTTGIAAYGGLDKNKSFRTYVDGKHYDPALGLLSVTCFVK